MVHYEDGLEVVHTPNRDAPMVRAIEDPEAGHDQKYESGDKYLAVSNDEPKGYNEGGLPQHDTQDISRKRRICGLPRKWFWVLVGVGAVIVVGAALGSGVGVGTITRKSGNNTSNDSTSGNSNSSSSTSSPTAASASGSSTSGGSSSPTSTTSSSKSTTTGSDSSQITSASDTSTTATATTLSTTKGGSVSSSTSTSALAAGTDIAQCPGADDTNYTPSGSSTVFSKHCNTDYYDPTGGPTINIDSTLNYQTVDSLNACIDVCLSYNSKNNAVLGSGGCVAVALDMDVSNPSGGQGECWLKNGTGRHIDVDRSTYDIAAACMSDYC